MITKIYPSTIPGLHLPQQMSLAEVAAQQIKAMDAKYICAQPAPRLPDMTYKAFGERMSRRMREVRQS